MTNWRGTSILALVFAIALIGIATTTENAYAGFNGGPHCSPGETSGRAAPIVTSIVPTVDGAVIDWTQAERDRDRGSYHISCSYPIFFEIEVTETAPVSSPFLFEDEEIPGGPTGTYTLEGLECETEYFFDIDGLWPRHKDGADHSFTTLACAQEPDHGQLVEVHCDVRYEWEMFLIFGERSGYGECLYIYQDGFEQEEEVHVSGDFTTGFSGQPRPISGDFHIEDYEDNALWLEEEGTIEFPCSRDTEPEHDEIPYCLDTEVTVEEGEGIFSFLSGEGTRTADGYIEHLGIFSDGYAYSTIWVFFDCEECEPEEDDGNDGSENAERPSIGVLKTGQRVVTGGLTVNGVTIDADYWATEFEQINVELGKPIKFKFVIYDDRLDNIKHVQLQLGKGQIGESFSEIGSATWDRHVMTKKATVTHDDIFTDVGMWRAPDVDCMVGSTECTVIMAEVTPTRAIVDNIVFGVNIWDDNGNASQTYFNHGIQVGNHSDVIIVDNSIPKVVKKQLITDDGLGNVNDRNSEAFKMMADWNMQNQIAPIVAKMGY